MRHVSWAPTEDWLGPKGDKGHLPLPPVLCGTGFMAGYQTRITLPQPHLCQNRYINFQDLGIQGGEGVRSTGVSVPRPQKCDLFIHACIQQTFITSHMPGTRHTPQYLTV